MTRGKPLVDALADLFGEIELTSDEIDEALLDAGFSPDAIGKRMATAAQKALKKTKVKYGL